METVLRKGCGKVDGYIRWQPQACTERAAIFAEQRAAAETRCQAGRNLRFGPAISLSRREDSVLHDDRELARLAVRIGTHLYATNRRVATAESCTGGWIAKALTDIAGSSAWVLEGFVTYSNDAKMRTLGVSRRALEFNGAVSEPVARAMARGALERSGADLAMAVTGIAGPGGGVPGKPVGTVWLAWAARRGRRIHVDAVVRHFKGDREAVRRKTVRAAMMGVLAR